MYAICGRIATDMPTRGYFIAIPVVVFLIGMLGTVFVEAGMEWYRTLVLPPWTPTGEIIGFAWGVNFLFVTIAAILLWMRVPRGRTFTTLAVLLAGQAFFFVGWTFVFFAQHLVLPAVLISGLYALDVWATAVIAYPKSREATVVLIPYAAWVTFATYLTYVVWTLNQG